MVISMAVSVTPGAEGALGHEGAAQPRGEECYVLKGNARLMDRNGIDPEPRCVSCVWKALQVMHYNVIQKGAHTVCP